MWLYTVTYESIFSAKFTLKKIFINRIQNKQMKIKTIIKSVYLSRVFIDWFKVKSISLLLSTSWNFCLFVCLNFWMNFIIIFVSFLIKNFLNNRENKLKTNLNSM